MICELTLLLNLLIMMARIFAVRRVRAFHLFIPERDIADFGVIRFFP